MAHPSDDRPKPEQRSPDEPATERARRPEDTALWVDQQIRAAIDRGEFDDLPYTGKPLPDHLVNQADPDWWLKRLIEREQVTGVLPEALQLRKDDTGLAARLDSLARPGDVREAVAEFNRRIIEARRQLAGGPPVITPLRDVEVEVDAWWARRRARSATVQPASEAGTTGRRWFRRR